MTCRLGHHKEGRTEVGLLRPFLFVGQAFVPVLFFVMVERRTEKSFHISFDIGEFNLQVQQWNSFSLQRSDMFIATSAHPKDLASLGAKPGSGTIAEAGKVDCALRSLEVKRGPPSYKHLAPMGRSDNDPLHFQVEFAK